MKVKRMGHAALLIETGSDRILVDPGGFSDDWHGLEGLSAILVTHQHADHVDAANLAGLVANNRDARVLVEESVVPILDSEGVPSESTRPGDRHAFGDLEIEVVGGRHAVIHERLPSVGNVGFVFDEGGGARLYHPGDSYDYPLERVDVLALPLTAPWARVETTVDFLQAVAPSRAFPIHDAIVNDTGWNLYMRMVGQLGGEDVDLIHVDPTGEIEI